jgi:uncharacterized membrane protein
MGITVVGALLRLVSLNNRSFWLDETTSVRQASWSIPDLIVRMSDNVHPILFHTMLHYWIGVFGRSEIAVRAFPVIFGIAAIPLAYWTGLTIYNRRVGLITAAMLAISPFFIWYSQEARMYTLMLVFALASTAFFWKALQENRFKWWALFTLSTAAGSMTQYFYLFLVAGQVLYFVVFTIADRERGLDDIGSRHAHAKRPLRLFRDVPQLYGLIGSLAVASLPSVWWLPKVLAHQDLLRGLTGPFNYGWSPPTFGVHFNEMIAVPVEWIFGFHSIISMHDLVAVWPLFLTVAFLSTGHAHQISRRTWYVVVTGVGACAMIAAIGLWQPILEARYFTAATAPLLVLVARLLADLKTPSFRLVMALLVAISAVAWVDQSYNPSGIVKWDNRQAMSIVDKGYQPGDVILLFPYFASSIPEYYLPPIQYASVRKVPSFDRFGQLRNSPATLGEDLDRQVGAARRVWIVATWQDTPRIALDRTNTVDWLGGRGFHETEDDQLNQIRVSLYVNSKPPSLFSRPGVTKQ